MSEDSLKNRNTSNEEIDLLELFRRIGRTISCWLNAIGRAILISIVFLVRNWFFLFLSIALGSGAAVLVKRSAKPAYTSDMVLKVNVQPVSEMIAYINRLNTLCASEDKTELAKVMSISSDQVNRIGDISAFWIIDKGNDSIPDYVDYLSEQNVYDTVNVRMKDRLDVRVSAESPQDLSAIRDGIIKYLNGNELFKAKNDVRLQQMEEMITRLSFDIKELDSLQKIKFIEEAKNVVPKTSGQMVFLQEQRTQLLYADVHRLYERKQKLEKEINIYRNIVTLLSDFTVPASRSNGTYHYVKKIVPVFFFLTLIILIIKHNRRGLIDLYNKY